MVNSEPPIRLPGARSIAPARRAGLRRRAKQRSQPQGNGARIVIGGACAALIVAVVVGLTVSATKAATDTPSWAVERTLQRWREGGQFQPGEYHIIDVDSWEILGVSDLYANKATVRALVNSSTKGGEPVRTRWRFTVERKDSRAAWDVTDVDEDTP